MRSWRSKPWLLWALLMVPAAATIAGIGTYTRVLGPEDAPRPSRGDLVGRYEDGRGGVVVLREDGSATVSGIGADTYDDAGEREKPCGEDAGTWFFDETLPGWHPEVRVFGDCRYFDPWDVDGPPSAPRMIHWAEPGYPEGRRVLTRR
ncbi:hypothetical protein ACFY9F_32135 [Streptomyces sp. NPDC012421]|uniref:hypothetical protein n=1 Tax=Streptomyces sp. NPDC012421 TaxID=3364832 RepID=UPI0036E7C760